LALTFEQVARQVVAAVDSNATYLLAFEWLKQRYEQLATRAKLRHLRHIGSVSVPASIDTGTVSITRGTRTVIADADATLVWSPALVGRHFRGRVTWYEIVGYSVVGGFGTLQLDADFNEDDVDDGAYRIVPRFSTLAADAAQIGDTFINPRRRHPIELWDYQKLDRHAPSRPQVGGGAMVVAEVPNDGASGLRRVEFYPYSSTSETYFYTYWRALSTIQMSDYLHPQLPAYGLIEGGLINLYRYKMGQAIDAKNAEAAAFWRNEMRTQETKWNQFIVEMISADRGEDDASFILKHIGAQVEPRDIVTARDHVLADWNWP
jgi:hypothetical protein